MNKNNTNTNTNKKTNKKVILVDFDSVLYPWVEQMIKMLKEKDINEEVKNVITYNYFHDKYGNDFIKDIYNSGDFYKDTLPFEGAKEFLQDLNEKYNVKIVTVSGSKENELSKKNFIELHFKGLYSELIFEKNKHLVQGDAFVDDSFENIYSMINEKRILSICYNHENRYRYNEQIFDNKYFKRGFSYNDIKYILDKHL